MRRALEDLERPDLMRRILLVAGTNGKGSTGAMAAAAFERAALLGLVCFACHKTDVAVVETGLGGPLDATAVLRPHVPAMTRIAIDHREYFGSSLAEGARAEASTLKPNASVAVAPGQAPGAMEVLRAEAARMGASLWPCSDEYAGPLSRRGFGAAFAALRLLPSTPRYRLDSRSPA